VLGLVFKTSVGHFVPQVGSTPTSFRHTKLLLFNRLLVIVVALGRKLSQNRVTLLA
jgi:hypothetical protein